MNVHVTGTPEITQKQIKGIVSFLNKTKGPISFKFLEKIKNDDLTEYIEKFRSFETLDEIEFMELSGFCNSYRTQKNIKDDEIIVVLTSKKMSYGIGLTKEWVSLFIDNNIIVRTNDWEGCDDIEPELLISHQIIENVFQILSKIKIDDFNDVHFYSKSCINDFCSSEIEIQHKIRAGGICKICYRKAIDRGVEYIFIEQIIKMLGFIREEILGFKSILNETPLKPINISINGDVTIGDKKIDFDFITHTVYIFFILHRGETFRATNLKNYEKELRNIFDHLKNSESQKPIDTLLGINTSRDVSSILREHRGDIKKYLKNSIGEELSEIYKIGNSKHTEGAVVHYHSQFPKNEMIEVNINDEFLKHIRMI